MERLKDFINILRKIEYTKPQPKFCPKCKSKKVSQLSELGIFPATYRCKECGYQSAIFLEID